MRSTGACRAICAGRTRWSRRARCRRAGGADAARTRPPRRRPHRHAATDRGVRRGRRSPEADRWHPWQWCPRVATTQNGRRPAARSSATARSSSSTRIRNPSSAGIERTAFSPRPIMSAASAIVACASSDAYRTSRIPSTPSARTSPGACASRAALRAVKFDAAPPLVISPPAPSGRPNLPAIQRMRWSSSSLAPAERLQPPTFGLRPAASRSAAAPGTVPEPEM